MIVIIRFVGGPKDGQLCEIKSDGGGWPTEDILQASMTADGQVYEVGQDAGCFVKGVSYALCIATLD